MRSRIPGAIIVLAVGILIGRYLWPAREAVAPPTAVVENIAPEKHVTYVCPMHPDVVSDQPGTCPKCGMALVQVKQDSVEHAHAGQPMQEQDMPVDADGPAHLAVRIDPQVINNLGVRLATVTRTTLVRRIDTPGFVQQIQPGPMRWVTAPFDAQVVAIGFTPEHWLEEGKPLVVLESAILREAEQAHLALLTKNEAQAAPQTETQTADTAVTLDISRQRLIQLGLSVADIQHLEKTRETSAQLTIFAPYTVKVSAPQIAVGDGVAAGAQMFQLTGMARASVLANAFQRDAAWIQTGQPCEVHLPHVSGEVWPGVVNQGAVSIDPDSQNIGVRLSFSAPMELLKSAMYVVATIHGDSREGVLVVPQEALIRTEHEDRIVVAQGGGRFKPVPVRVGLESSGQAEVLSGLEEGQQVVVSAQFLIDSESSLQASFLRMSGQAAE